MWTLSIQKDWTKENKNQIDSLHKENLKRKILNIQNIPSPSPTSRTAQATLSALVGDGGQGGALHIQPRKSERSPNKTGNLMV